MDSVLLGLFYNRYPIKINMFYGLNFDTYNIWLDVPNIGDLSFNCGALINMFTKKIDFPWD